MAKGIEKGMAKGIEEGMAKGREEGEKNKALAIARQMLADGMPAESVARYTNLTDRRGNQTKDIGCDE